MNYEIDNPGGGDCGFYAFSIGLIEIIQKEYQQNKISPTFNKWSDEGLVGIRLEEDLLKIDLQNLGLKQDLLAKLQMSLRSIVAKASTDDLIDKIKQERKAAEECEAEEECKAEKLSIVEGSPIFGKFLELVKFYKDQGTSRCFSADFNELASSFGVIELAKKTAETLALKIIENQPFKEAQTIENAHIKAALIADVDGASPSCILKAVDLIKEQGRCRWATHSDLNTVAAQLKVNLLVTGKENGAVQEGLPTITLKNESNRHWTTIVDLPRPLSSKEEQVLLATLSTQVRGEKIQEYKKYLTNYIIALSAPAFFSKVPMQSKINIWELDQVVAERRLDNHESDEDFALRVQEAEYRRSGL